MKKTPHPLCFLYGSKEQSCSGVIFNSRNHKEGTKFTKSKIILLSA